MTEPQAALFEFGQRPKSGPIGVVDCGVDQLLVSRKDFQHLLGVIFPIGSQVKIAAKLEFVRQQFDEGGLDQATLLMLGLMPGVWEVNVNSIQAAISDHVLQNFDCVVLDDAKVIQVAFANLFQ
jgi:hypothetical protein